MLKRIIAFVLLLALVCSVTVYASGYGRNMAAPSLSFSGRTAICEFRYSEKDEKIEATLELWCGSTRVAAWTKSGNSSVSFSEGCPVSSGTTYTLKAHGTCGGVSFTSPSVTKTCL